MMKIHAQNAQIPPGEFKLAISALRMIFPLILQSDSCGNRCSMHAMHTIATPRSLL